MSHWFADIEETMHLWDKSYFIIVYESFNILLELFISEGQEQKDFSKFKKDSKKVAANW